MLQKTYSLFDFLMRHSFHYWIWTFCALFIIFDKILHMPLELLSHFNFIPEFMINLSKIINTQPIETSTAVPAINVVVENKEILSALTKMDQTLLTLSDNIVKLNIQLVENNALFQANVNTILDMSRILYNTNQLVTENVGSILQETNSLLKTNIEAQIKIAKRVIFTIQEVNKPLFNIQGSLSYLAFTQNQILSGVQTTQDLVLQSYSSILNNQIVSFDLVQGETSKIFTKINEVRNHNLSLYKQLTNDFDMKLCKQQSEIIEQIIAEFNRPKISSTEVNSMSSWSNFFNKK